VEFLRAPSLRRARAPGVKDPEPPGKIDRGYLGRWPRGVATVGIFRCVARDVPFTSAARFLAAGPLAALVIGTTALPPHRKSRGAPIVSRPWVTAIALGALLLAPTPGTAVDLAPRGPVSEVESPGAPEFGATIKQESSTCLDRPIGRPLRGACRTSLLPSGKTVAVRAVAIGHCPRRWVSYITPSC